ncbi:hypothetical protein GYH30_029331 [Glycine max]|uniref:Uncharacterized protein n=1 Tax=Glycine max TaxID=3847 RepID=K7LLT8_SOYBN|nr:hypothetical protein GYH30_029331 [Glycine max]
MNKRDIYQAKQSFLDNQVETTHIQGQPRFERFPLITTFETNLICFSKIQDLSIK